MLGFHCRKRAIVTLMLLVDNELAMEVLHQNQYRQMRIDIGTSSPHQVWLLPSCATSHSSGTQIDEVLKEQLSFPLIEWRSPVVTPKVCERESQVSAELLVAEITWPQVVPLEAVDLRFGLVPWSFWSIAHTMRPPRHR